MSKNVFLIFKALVLLASLMLSLPSVAQNLDNLVVVVGGNETITTNKNQTVLSQVVNYGADYLAELQETISFNAGLNKNLGIGLSNSRRIFPLSNGDFIVTDETAIEANFHLNALERLRDNITASLRFEGAARPSLKRFFISPSVDRRQRNEYVSFPGPSGTEVLYGLDNQNFDLGGGVRIDATSYARYNNWFDRFTKNITQFPINISLADQMEVGEGYSFAFEGAASFGPSALFHLLQSNSFSLTPSFQFLKVLKTGKFELIILKSERNKLLFSIRQVRTVGDSNFLTRWGVHAGPNLDLIIGSTLPSFVPDYVQLVKFERTSADSVEERFNSVYEIDLSNPADRSIYNETLLSFDFSLLEVFSMRDISTTSTILEKFRNSSLKLLLDIKTKVDVMVRNSNFNFLISRKEWLRSRESFVDGSATYEDRRVDIAGGNIINRVASSSYLWGENINIFEFKAYEEYGEEARNLPTDIVLLARKTLFDDYTEHYQKTDGANVDYDELSTHVSGFNKFTQSTNAIQMTPANGVRDLETTKGLMEFFLTRDDIRIVAHYNERDFKKRVIDMMAYKTSLLGIGMSAGRQAQLLNQDPSDWSFWVRPQIKNAFRDFLIGHQMLKLAVTNPVVDLRAPESARAISKMLSYPALAETYAELFRYALVMAGSTPKINITFSNTYLRRDFTEKAYPEAEFASRGFLTQENLNRSLGGLSYFDDVNNQYLSSVSKDGSKIRVNFRWNHDFRGFLKILYKRKTPGDDTTYNQVGEFVVDLKNYTEKTFVFDSLGSSVAESYARSLVESSDKVFIALSFDNKAYDEEKEVE